MVADASAGPPVEDHRDRPLLGSHVATGGGLVRAGLAEATEIGAEVIQVFAGNPRSWRTASADSKQDDDFRTACVQRGLPVYVHAPHLINLGSPSAETLSRSVDALVHTMGRAASLGARAVVVHGGSSVTPERRTEALGRLHGLVSQVLDAAPEGVGLLIEPTAGGGSALASTIESTVEYLAAVDDERVGVCLDTCHLHAAGEEIARPGGLAAAVRRLALGIGEGRLGLVHVNDSRDPAGSRRDRHESLAKGVLGEPWLTSLFSIPELRGVPHLVETPTHSADVALLKELRASRAV